MLARPVTVNAHSKAGAQLVGISAAASQTLHELVSLYGRRRPLVVEPLLALFDPCWFANACVNSAPIKMI